MLLACILNRKEAQNKLLINSLNHQIENLSREKVYLKKNQQLN